MPVAPSPAQSAASRANGALSHGPATPEGKARSAQNAIRHGLRAARPGALPPEDAAALAALRDALTARFAPADALEHHWVGEMAFALWQQRKLQALTAAVLAYAENGTDEPEPQARAEPDTARLPSLSTLARYRARIERDLRLARQELEGARQSRPRLPADPQLANPARLRWLADRVEAAVADRAPANDTGEPDAQPEPGPVASACTSEPERPQPLNRRERRRQEALRRKASSAPSGSAVTPASG